MNIKDLLRNLTLAEKLFLVIDVILFLFFIGVLFSSSQNGPVYNARKDLSKSLDRDSSKESEKLAENEAMETYIDRLEKQFFSTNDLKTADKLVDAYYNIGKYALSEKYLDILLKSQDYPKDEDFYKRAVKVKLACQKVKEAQKLLSKISERDAVYYANKGEIAFYEKKYEEALDYYWRAYQLDSRNPDIINNIGYINFLLGKNDEAKSFFLKALKLDERNLSALKNLAILYVKIADFKKAFYYFNQIVKYYPESQDAEEAMKAMKKIGRELLKK